MCLASRFLVVFVLSLLVAACGGGGTQSSNERAQIASVQLMDGNQQTATVDTELPVALTARALDTSGAPVVGVVLNFRVTAGGGTVFAGSAATDATGVARERWTLGPTAGPQRLEVRAVDGAGTAIVYATFDATATPDVPASVAVMSGGDQQAQQASTLPAPVRFRVLDRFGNPVPGVGVSLAASHGGAATPALSTSSTAGDVETSWTLGLAVGDQQLTASTSAGVAIQASALVTQAPPGAPVAVAKHAGDLQAVVQHGQLTQALAVRVTDQIGNPVPGVQVTFSAAAGSGFVQPTTVSTDMSGLASWRGHVHTSGVQRIEAVVAGVGGVVFELTVAVSTHVFDGAYECIYRRAGLAPGTVVGVNLDMAVANGIVTGALRTGRHMPDSSVDEATGAFQVSNFHTSLDGWMNMTGTFAVGANGHATASGATEDYMIASPQGNGTWTCDRL